MSQHSLITTFDPKLDAILGGGIPAHSFNILAGAPGAGKTIFAHQLLYQYLKDNPEDEVLYLTTLSEPPAKIIRYMRAFDFFDADLFQERFRLDDVGSLIREESMDDIIEYILNEVQRSHPNILVIDSFKAIRDLANSLDGYRRFVYKIAVQLFGARCTSFLVGEYTSDQVSEGAEFAVADGIFTFDTIESSGESQRIFQVQKLRGQNANRDRIPFSITKTGITFQYVNSSLPLSDMAPGMDRLPTGILGLDQMLEGGLLPGRAVLISGVSGTGKTTLVLQTMQHAAQSGQRVLYYSFEESVPDLLMTANRFGWEAQHAIDTSQIQVVHIPQTDIKIEREMVRFEKEMQQSNPHWLIIDSFSVFLHRVKDPALFREKMYQVKYLIAQTNTIGLLISDIPVDAPGRLSRVGVEETVADGTIVLSSLIKGETRRRFIEIYKMRQTNHVKGTRRMAITSHGIEVYYIKKKEQESDQSKITLSFAPVKSLMKKNLRYDNAWLVRGEPGLGKSSFAAQFAADGLRQKESVLFVALDAPSRDIENRLKQMKIKVPAELKSGKLRILDGYEGKDAQLDLSDPEVVVHYINEIAHQMEKPLRVIFDSITSFAVLHSPQEFVKIIHRKNRILRHPKITLLDTHLFKHNNNDDPLALLNGYDIVIDLYAIGETTGMQTRRLQIAKSREVKADATPQPYEIESEQGIVVSGAKSSK